MATTPAKALPPVYATTGMSARIGTKAPRPVIVSPGQALRILPMPSSSSANYTDEVQTVFVFFAGGPLILKFGTESAGDPALLYAAIENPVFGQMTVQTVEFGYTKVRAALGGGAARWRPDRGTFGPRRPSAAALTPRPLAPAYRWCSPQSRRACQLNWAPRLQMRTSHPKVREGWAGSQWPALPASRCRALTVRLDLNPTGSSPVCSVWQAKHDSRIPSGERAVPRPAWVGRAAGLEP